MQQIIKQVSICKASLLVSTNINVDTRSPRERIREGGRTYFIAVQQIIEQVSISKASLLVSTNINVDTFNIESGHSCFNCTSY